MTNNPEVYRQPGMYSISEATHEDRDSLREFLQTAYADTYPNHRGITRDMFTGDDFRSHLEGYIDTRLADAGSTLLLARRANELVGTIGITTSPDVDSAEVFGFYVRSNLQGHGCGRNLWQALLTDPSLDTINTLYLSVAKDSERAIAFYQQQGFVFAWEEDWRWPSWTEEELHNQYWKMWKIIN